MMASPATSVCKWHTSGNYRPETNDSFAPERGQPRPVEKNDGKGALPVARFINWCGSLDWSV
jgi:hypothetical protein